MALIAQDPNGGLNVLGGSGDNSGLGGGLLGALVLASLLGGRGLGGIGYGGVAPVATDGGTLTGITNAIDLSAITSTLSRIEASVPYNEGQVQLALAQSTAAIQNTANNNAQVLLASQNAIARDAATSNALLTRDIAAVATDVARESCAIQHAICEDGNATRALITNNLIAQLQADKVILENKLTEERHERRREIDRHGVEVTTIVNQNQTQAQLQAQAQRFDTLQGTLIQAMQAIHASNQAINIGAGTQTATPVNTSTNNRVNG